MSADAPSAAAVGSTTRRAALGRAEGGSVAHLIVAYPRPVVSREQGVDALYALDRLPFVERVLACAAPAERAGAEAAVALAVVLRPYTIRHLVEAHYALLAATSHDVTGRVLYVNPELREPASLARMAPLCASAEERAQGALRARDRANDAVWLARLEAAASARARSVSVPGAPASPHPRRRSRSHDARGRTPPSARGDRAGGRRVGRARRAHG
jgi:hypothetical protein